MRSGVGDVVILHHLAGGIELPEVPVVRNRIGLAFAGRVECNQNKYLVTAFEESVRFESGDLKRCESLEEPPYVRLTSTRLQPRHALDGVLGFPLDVFV